MERKMATIQQIAEVKPIDGADAIEAVRINGWWVVAKKGKYVVNDTVVYCEVDSWIPTAVAPFLTKPDHFPKEYNGVQGGKLRTVRLRGQLSQGLVLPLKGFDAYYEGAGKDLFKIGDDVSSFLNIQKWEAPEQAGTNRQARGNFPSFLRKTDQERVQNLGGDLERQQGNSFEVTIKIDGSSCTAYHRNGEVGVCSRNIELKDVEGNAFWDIVKQNNILDKLVENNLNYAVQGELIAPEVFIEVFHREMSGGVVDDTETMLLKWLRKISVNPEVKFDGYTEVFMKKDVSVEAVISKLIEFENLLGQQ